jgi:hypothetical protein
MGQNRSRPAAPESKVAFLRNSLRESIKSEVDVAQM